MTRGGYSSAGSCLLLAGPLQQDGELVSKPHSF